MTKIISSTEITAKNTCDKLHDYMYNQNLEPAQYSLEIRRGYTGHKVLQAYYECLRDNWNHEAAVNYASDTLGDIIRESDPEDTEHTQMLADLSRLLIKYFDYYRGDTKKYKILAVEKVFTTPISGETGFGMILDLLVERITGEFRGYVDIIDHKFTNNFKTNDDLRLDGQQPRYDITLRANGYPIKDCIFNQIRFRKIKDPTPDQLFRRSSLLSTSKAVQNIWNETRDTADKIHGEASGSYKKRTGRTLSYSACHRCFFRELCFAELAGQDTTAMRKIEFKQRQRPLQSWVLSNV